MFYSLDDVLAADGHVTCISCHVSTSSNPNWLRTDSGPAGGRTSHFIAEQPPWDGGSQSRSRTMSPVQLQPVRDQLIFLVQAVTESVRQSTPGTRMRRTADDLENFQLSTSRQDDEQLLPISVEESLYYL